MRLNRKKKGLNDMLDISKLQNELDADQFAAVTAPFGNMLCVANAGSGKTRVLTYRIAYLIANGEPEDSFLMLTFANKAARERMERIKNLLGSSRIQIMGGTFHSVAFKFIKMFQSFLKYEKWITVLCYVAVTRGRNQVVMSSVEDVVGLKNFFGDPSTFLCRSASKYYYEH